MAAGSESNVFVAVAGVFGKPDHPGQVGIFRRPSQGGEWEHVLDKVETNVVLVHPGDRATVFAGTVDGVWRSTDHGATFARCQFPVSGYQIWSLLIDQRNPDRLLAGASPVAIFESTDKGRNWRKLPETTIDDRAVGPFATRVMRMDQHPTRPDEVYAALEINGVMRSDDFGQSWTDCSADLIKLSAQPEYASKIVTNTEAEGMLDGHAIAICPEAPDTIVLACRMGLFRSTDRGAQWADANVNRFSPVTYARDLRVSTTEPGTLYAALSVAAASDDGAVYKSMDSGQSWQRFGQVKVHGTIMSVGLNNTNSDEVIIGARYAGEIYGTIDAGETWNALPLPGPVQDIYCIACG